MRALGPLLWTATAGLIVVYLAAAGLGIVERFHYPIELVYGEAIVLDEARRIGLGQPLYPAPTALPLTVTGYTPLYYLLVGWLQQLIGDTGYSVGRLVSVASVLASAGLLTWSVRCVAGRWSGGLLAAGLFLTQNLTVQLWAPVHRVDSLALCFTLLGLVLATNGRTSLAAFPFVLAVLTKQTHLAAPLCVAVTLWPRRGSMLRFGAVFLGGVLACLVVGQWLTNGMLVWHTFVANANPLDFQYYAAMLGAFLQFNALPLVAATALFALPARPPERLWRAYFLVAGLETLGTIGKVGASSNYWLELTAATTALIGLLSVRLVAAPDPQAALTSAAPDPQAALTLGLPRTQTPVSPAAPDTPAALTSAAPRTQAPISSAPDMPAVLTSGLPRTRTPVSPVAPDTAAPVTSVGGANSPFTSVGLASVVLASLLTCVPAYQATVSQALDLHLSGATVGIGPQLEAERLVAAEPGAVLTDDPGLALLAGKRVEFEFVIFTILATQGVWDQTPILDAIDARHFSLVVLEEPLDAPPQPLISARMTERVRAALHAAYTAAGQQDGYWFYRPS